MGRGGWLIAPFVLIVFIVPAAGLSVSVGSDTPSSDANTSPTNCEANPVASGDNVTTAELNWCRMSERQCVEYCRGLAFPLYHHNRTLCACSTNADANPDAVSYDDIFPASNCFELYHKHHVFLSGQYVIAPLPNVTITVICDIEGREICNGSLVHGASSTVEVITPPCSAYSTHTLIGRHLSPYSTAPGYTLCEGWVKVTFSHKLLVHGLFINGSGVNSVNLTYTFSDLAMSNWTNTSTYHYSAEMYGEPSTLTTTPGIFQPLRPFVADSVTLSVVNSAQKISLKFDLFGCKFTRTVEETLTLLPEPWSCSHWLVPDSSTAIASSRYWWTAVINTNSPFATLFKMSLTEYWALPVKILLGQALSNVTCPHTHTCSLLTVLSQVNGQYQCGREAEYTTELTETYQNVTEGNVTVGCQEDALKVFQFLRSILSTKYHKTCPMESEQLHTINYNQHTQSVASCSQINGTTITPASVSNTFSTCEEGGALGSTFVGRLYRNIIFSCNANYTTYLSAKFGGSFVETTPEGGIIHLRTVGQVSVGACQCPHTTSGQDLNQQKFVCAPDFTYHLESFLGCDRINCTNAPADAPANANMEWNQAITYGTIIKYICNTNFVFEAVGYPSSMNSVCGCGRKWKYEGDIILPPCIPVCPAPTSLPRGVIFASANNSVYVSGTQLTYNCSVVSGGSTYFDGGSTQQVTTCQADRTWTPTPSAFPRCLKLVMLGSAPNITGTTKTESLECQQYLDDGTLLAAPSVTYTCIAGNFEKTGSNTFTYTSPDCTWSSLSIPACLSTTTSTTLSSTSTLTATSATTSTTTITITSTTTTPTTVTTTTTTTTPTATTSTSTASTTHGSTRAARPPTTGKLPSCIIQR